MEIIMLSIPSSFLLQFEEYLQKKAVPKNQHASYKKWLCFYLDFYNKYNFPQTQSESLAHFLLKLQEKKQTKTQHDQASDAVSVYYKTIQQNCKKK